MNSLLHNDVIAQMLENDSHLFDASVGFVEMSYSSGLIVLFSLN